MSREIGAGKLFCWLSGVLTIAMCLGIIIYVAARGAPAISWDFISQPPKMVLLKGLSGGILTPLAGTIVLTAMSIILVLPLALTMAVYYAEYAGDNLGAKLLRLGNDVLAGVPTIVIALFGLIIFSYPELSFLSIKVAGTASERAFGRSFLAAAITMAVMVLPYITKSVEEAIAAVPYTFREAAYGLGVSKWRTIRKVVLPAACRGIASGAVLGVGRVASDVAIVWFCLGATLTYSGPEKWWQPQNWLDTLRSAGSTLSSYIYYASPVGNGHNAEKAYGAALVLIVIILLFNAAVYYINGLAAFRPKVSFPRRKVAAAAAFLSSIPQNIKK
ncbi:MAG: Phosphate transport system permease protein PstC [Pelotomaculum sp. PtaU1.Bin035]|nr:MAG: Phosphate transport system permease protein PstC [Pelotomaculum sp. PtaU1.Bin035]